MSDLREAIAKFMWRDGHEENGVNTDKLWEGMPDRFKVGWRDDAENLLALLSEHGLVELDADQSLPGNLHLGVGEAMTLKEAIAKFMFLIMLEAENTDDDYEVTDKDWDEFKLKHGDVDFWKEKADALLREHGLVQMKKGYCTPPTDNDDIRKVKEIA